MKGITALFFLILLCHLSHLESKDSKKYDLVICALFRNEELYMKEWIEFHKLMGVQHFYLYDNGSTDRSLEILKPYIKAKQVTLFSYPIETRSQHENLCLLQLPIYRQALEIVKKTAKWAAFIDLDEFLFPVKENNLITLLKNYTQYGGLAVNFQMYGTSNRENLNPGELITEALVWKMPSDAENNKFVKSIVQPNRVLAIHDPHSFHYTEGFYAVNSNGEYLVPGAGMHESIVIDAVRINHYWCGTQNWFFSNKLPLKIKWGWLHDPTPEFIENFLALFNVEKDEAIHKFVPALKKTMQRPKSSKKKM